ncbi:MAG: DUF5397 domain-containing protein [Cellvibrionaceae bacterium]|nr:DUF5397 domain-containing protein [Cellvibrionaceae bacterium]
MQIESFPSPELVGQFRQFGELGPAYKIVSPIRPLENDDWLLLIQMAETGEEIEYRYSRAEKDPVAH